MRIQGWWGWLASSSFGHVIELSVEKQIRGESPGRTAVSVEANDVRILIQVHISGESSDNDVSVDHDQNHW